MEDNGHDIPGGGKTRWGSVTTICSKKVALILRYAIVYFDVIISTGGVVLQLYVVKSEENRGALWYHNQPGTVNVIGVKSWEIWTGEITRWA